MRHFVALGELPIRCWKWARASSSVRVGPQEGSMTCPVTTSKLMNQDKMPYRIYSNSYRSTWPGCIGRSGYLRVFGLHSGQFIHADRTLPALGSFRGIGIHLTAGAPLPVPLRIGHLVQPVAEAVRGLAPFFSRARMPWRNLLNNASCHQFVRDFTPAPLADRPSCLQRRFTRQGRHLAALLRRELRRGSRSGPILQALCVTSRHKARSPVIPPSELATSARYPHRYPAHAQSVHWSLPALPLRRCELAAPAAARCDDVS